MATTITSRSSNLQSSFPSSPFDISNSPSYSSYSHSYQPHKYSAHSHRLSSINPGIMGFPDDTSNADNSSAPSRRRSIFRNPFRPSASTQGNSTPISRDSTGSSTFSLSRAFSGSQRDAPRPASPPPAYSVNTSGSVLAAPRGDGLFQSSSRPSTSSDDEYSFLATFDTVFLIDDSGSMAGRNWTETRLALDEILPKCIQHDTNGIDVYFLNHKTNDKGNPSDGKAGTGYLNVTRRTINDLPRGRAEGHQKSVGEIFSTVKPGAGTPTGTRLNHILRAYLQNYEDKHKTEEVKPMNIIVITDGMPTDEVEGVIIQAAERLDEVKAPPYQVGIQFFQVGNSKEASEALRELDDELSHRGKGKGKIRDIVDTVSFDYRPDGQVPKLTSEGILKTVLGAVVKRQDRKILRPSARGLA